MASKCEPAGHRASAVRKQKWMLVLSWLPLFTLYIAYGTLGHGRTLPLLGWVFPLLTSLEMPLSMFPN